MKTGQASRTAQFVAAARGMGMLLPENVRIADDPYGTLFSSTGLAKLLERRGARALAGLPGLKTWIVYMQVRTRVLDDAVRDFAAAGGRQLVLLGAGYDCRALRMPELAGARVFEVDHPATQTHKRAVLAKVHVDSPATYVTWDFEARPMAELPAALVAAGHDPAAPTLTIWEGVTMYLTEGAIEASLRAIATYSAPGSRLAMTYFAKSRLAEPSPLTRVVAAVVSRLGEPFKWGWEPDELPGWMRERGFDVVRDSSSVDAARELMPPDLAQSVRTAPSRVAVCARRS